MTQKLYLRRGNATSGGGKKVAKATTSKGRVAASAGKKKEGSARREGRRNSVEAKKGGSPNEMILRRVQGEAQTASGPIKKHVSTTGERGWLNKETQDRRVRKARSA